MPLAAPATHGVQAALDFAKTEAERLANSHIGVEHLLLGLLHVHGEDAAFIRRFRPAARRNPAVRHLLGVSSKKIEEVIRHQNTGYKRIRGAQIGYSQDAEMALRMAVHEAYWMDRDTLATGHLLLGILLQPKGRVVAEVLGFNRWQQTVEELRQELATTSEQAKKSRYTRSAKLVISFAQDEARDMRHDSVGTEHLLIGMLREHKGLAGRVLKHMGVDAMGLRARVVQMRPSLTKDVEVFGLGEGYKRLLNRASNERYLRRHALLSTGHLLYHLLLMDDDDIALRALRRLNVRIHEIRKDLSEYVQMQLPVLEGIKGADFAGRAGLFTLTFEAQRCFIVAEEEANRLDHRIIETGHLLMALMIDEEGLTSHILRECQIDRRRARALIEIATMREYRYRLNPRLFSENLRETVEIAIDLACDDCEYPVLNPLHLLLALLFQEGSVAQRVLAQLNVEIEQVQQKAMMELERRKLR